MYTRSSSRSGKQPLTFLSQSYRYHVSTQSEGGTATGTRVFNDIRWGGGLLALLRMNMEMIRRALLGGDGRFELQTDKST